MDNRVTLKIRSIDNGFCRVNYTWKNSKNETVYYCIQDDGVGHGINIYRQSSDEEPDYIVTPKCYASFEIMKVFEHFNNSNNDVCPVCNTNKDLPVILLPMPQTEKDGVCQVYQVHKECYDKIIKIKVVEM